MLSLKYRKLKMKEITWIDRLLQYTCPNTHNPSSSHCSIQLSDGNYVVVLYLYKLAIEQFSSFQFLYLFVCYTHFWQQTTNRLSIYISLSLYIKVYVCTYVPTYVPFTRANFLTNLHQILHRPPHQFGEGS